MLGAASPLWTTLSSTQCGICEINSAFALSFTHTDKLGITPSKICSYNIEIERRVIPGFTQCPVPSVGETAGLYCHAKQNINMPGGRKGFAVCQRQRLHGKIPFTAHLTSTLCREGCGGGRQLQRQGAGEEKEKKGRRNERWGREGGPLHTTFLKCHWVGFNWIAQK